MIGRVNQQTLIAAYERHARWLPTAVTGALAVALGMQLAVTGWALVPAPAGQWQPLPERGSAAPSGTPAGPDIEAIVAAQLFGQPAAAVASERIEDAPDTRLSLKLLGVYATDDQQRSRAIIAQSGAPSGSEEETYAVGDDISRGVRLQAIYADRVILARQGVLETLRMERDAPSTATAPVASSGGGDRLTARDPARLGEIRAQLLNDPSQVQSFIRAVPARSGGVQRGYRVYPGRDRSLFTASGLRPGDLVTAVNGVTLDDQSKALQLLNELTGATSVEVTVERSGTVRNYTLSTQ